MTSKSTAIAKDGGPSGLAIADNDLLGELDLDLPEMDGLEEADGSDIRIASKVWNLKGVDDNGTQRSPNQFYDTVDETVSDSVHCVFLYMHKSRRWQRFDDNASRNQTICSSDDRRTGLKVLNSTELTECPPESRQCEGCPDAKWRTNDGGKRSVNCSEVRTMLALDLDSSRAFTMRFSKTSEKSLTSYLQKHHLGRRVSNGRAGNYPLYVFECNITLKLDKGGNYAIPVLARGEVMPKDGIAWAANQAMQLRDLLLANFGAIEAQAETVTATVVDSTDDSVPFDVG